MKVLHVTNLYPSPANPYQGTFVAEQVEALRALGVGCEVHALEGRGLARYALGTRRLRARLATFGPDVVHAHYGWSMIPVLLAGPRCPIVLSYCGNDALPVPASDPVNRGRNALSALVNRFLAPRAAAVVVKAAVLGRHLRRTAGLRAGRLRVVPNGVDLGGFPLRPREACRIELGLDPDRRYVLTLGDPGDRSGVKRVDLARRGTPPEATFLNPYPVRRELVSTWMNAADVYLLTSACEGSPNVVKEALACGTPVVSTAVGDVPERIAGLPGCRIVAADERAIREAVGRTLAERPMDREAIRSGVRWLQKDAIARRILEVYEEVVASPRYRRRP